MTTNDIRLAKTGLPPANAVRTRTNMVLAKVLAILRVGRSGLGIIRSRHGTQTPDIFILPVDYVTLECYSLYEGRRILIREAAFEDTAIGKRVDLEVRNIALYTFPIRHTPSVYNTGYILVRLLHCTTDYAAERCALVAWLQKLIWIRSTLRSLLWCLIYILLVLFVHFHLACTISGRVRVVV